MSYIQPPTIDTDLAAEFIAALPPHLYQLIRSCKIKATSSAESRSIVILSPSINHARCLLAQPELGQIERDLGVTNLRVICQR